ncbi:CLM9 protein, partial [Oreocharis arfaki]|nr:CLM9 protein [Oreocharis arfaki]
LQGQTPDIRRQREGDTLYIQCPYAAEITDQKIKYWCRLTDTSCQVLAFTYEGGEQSKDGRSTIKDDTTNRTLSVTMTDLKTGDSGTYYCAYYFYGYKQLRTISLNVFKGEYLYPTPSQVFSKGNTFLILSVVLLILLILALIASTALGVRHSKLLRRAGKREAEDTSDRAEGTAQPGSTGRRESSQDGSNGPAYINLDMQSYPSPEDPLYCNVEPSQAHGNPQDVEYAIIAFSQSAGNGRE